MTKITAMINSIARCSFATAITAGLLLASCTTDDSVEQQNDRTQLSLNVVENDWQGETIAISRSGETLEGLRATTGALPTGYGYGFGIYCDELSVANTQVTWDNLNGKWEIGGAYNTYWRRNQGGTLNIYAYAPYKTTPYTITDGNKLTFNAGHHEVPGYTNLLSGDNVDLLYASQTSYSRNSNESAVLEFRHALAKMTFGTVTNNTGGPLF